MKKVFIITAFAGLMSCSESKPEIIIMTPDIDFDFAQDEGVSDSLVYGEIEPNIDSLENVGELLDYLETIPSTHR